MCSSARFTFRRRTNRALRGNIHTGIVFPSKLGWFVLFCTANQTSGYCENLRKNAWCLQTGNMKARQRKVVAKAPTGPIDSILEVEDFPQLVSRTSINAIKGKSSTTAKLYSAVNCGHVYFTATPMHFYSGPIPWRKVDRFKSKFPQLTCGGPTLLTGWRTAAPLCKRAFQTDTEPPCRCAPSVFPGCVAWASICCNVSDWIHGAEYNLIDLGRECISLPTEV